MRKIITCYRCNKAFLRTGKNQMYCGSEKRHIGCAYKNSLKRNLRYFYNHHEKIVALNRKYKKNMGIFNTVKYKANCWKCSNLITEFQTKDGKLDLSLVSPKQIGMGKFYITCTKCHAFNEYDVIPKEVEIIFNKKESKLQTN